MQVLPSSDEINAGIPVQGLAIEVKHSRKPASHERAQVPLLIWTNPLFIGLLRVVTLVQTAARTAWYSASIDPTISATVSIERVAPTP